MALYRVILEEALCRVILEEALYRVILELTLYFCVYFSGRFRRASDCE